MGGEFLSGLDDGLGTTYKVEHDFERIITGDIDSVRAGLIDAMEQLGYRVSNDNPIRGCRKARGLGKSWSSNNILDYQSNLNISLKKISGSTTRAIFDYSISYTMLMKGDRATLHKEVDALIALMNSRTGTTSCIGCGSMISAGTRYCRQCGAPNQSATPAEVEVYQMTALVNTGNKNLVGGFIFVLVALLLPLFLFLGDPQTAKFAKLLKVIIFFAAASGVTGLAMLYNAIRINRRMIRDDEDDEAPATFTRQAIGAPDTASLPPRRDPVESPSSITESTTSLLEKERN